MGFLAVLWNCIRWAKFLFSFPTFKAQSLCHSRHQAVKNCELGFKWVQVTLLIRNGQSMNRWLGQLGKKMSGASLHWNGDIYIFAVLMLFFFFLSYLLQGVFYIKLYMFQLMPCGMFFWYNGIPWGAVLCNEHRVQECIHHFIHVLWTASFFIHILRKMTILALPAQCWIPRLRFQEKYSIM